ncbi:MAG: hypothetical protein U9Q78_02115 [Chloroflexota bacterium]|nr:hypothetical protein [Chloroflexota bacterium]
MRKATLLTFYFIPPGSDPDWSQEVRVFLARSWRGKPAESEEMGPRWVAYGDVPYEEMWADDRIWLPRVLRGERLDGVFTFADLETIFQESYSKKRGKVRR